MVEKEVILSGTVHKYVLCSFSRWFQSRRAANTIKEAVREIGSRLPQGYLKVTRSTPYR